VLSEISTYNIQLYSNLFSGYTFYYDLPLSGSVGGISIYVKNNLTQIQLDKLKIQSIEIYILRWRMLFTFGNFLI